MKQSFPQHTSYVSLTFYFSNLTGIVFTRYLGDWLEVYGLISSKMRGPIKNVTERIFTIVHGLGTSVFSNSSQNCQKNLKVDFWVNYYTSSDDVGSDKMVPGFG